MFKKKEILVTAFALFSLFFGAGNLILPPLLGFKAGGQWLIVTIGFCLSAMVIPLLGILAHAKLQGTLIDFGKKISPTFSLVYSFFIYTIAITLPGPRTASVTHEMAIQPFWDISPWFTSSIYFGLVFIFAMNRSKILGILGKLLTPAIILILIFVIGITLFSFPFDFGTTTIVSPFTNGILEGYQTFDAIGAVVVGGVIIISINLKHTHASYEDKKSLIRNAGWLAGLALFLIYMGLILSGALVHSVFDADTTRTALLSGLAIQSLGNVGNFFLSVLVGIACFTTAVGIVTGTADFVKSRFNNSQTAYNITAIIGSVLGVLMGQFNVGYIIAVALPSLMFIYPITIILILLNVVPDRFASPLVFKVVTIATILFSVPDFLGSISAIAPSPETFFWIPLQQYSLGWVLPALVVFVFLNTILLSKKK
ncbi:branched-chain amino acid transport system II carrier protein [Maribacter sp. ACAM166]|uniref:branched-chain amino acid transport system II carrier protein n=1 Tax=Maribacter sp. ACAM166 TaxID=2508996 RepID=UPI0010FDADE2|nr:branched-chain amino acid transport system II carrier protein [Maribacter sp. ACAM166]TLP77308.1 branched-chain amino acid ABC transporter substrate-binding protein [Maribacter sp. ACAM166]